MTLLSMLDRFEQAAVTYETSTDKADSDELHAARRAIMEAFEAKDSWNHLRAEDIMTLGKQIGAAEAREAELVKALEPFADMGGEMFARGWDATNVALALDNPDDPHRVTAGDFFAARAAIRSIEQE